MSQMSQGDIWNMAINRRKFLSHILAMVVTKYGIKKPSLVRQTYAIPLLHKNFFVKIKNKKEVFQPKSSSWAG